MANYFPQLPVIGAANHNPFLLFIFITDFYQSLMKQTSVPLQTAQEVFPLLNSVINFVRESIISSYRHQFIESRFRFNRKSIYF